MFIFQSDLWQYSEKHVLAKNMILDFFRGEEVDSINLAGLTYVISVTALGDDSEEKPKIVFRVYCIFLNFLNMYVFMLSLSIS